MTGSWSKVTATTLTDRGLAEFSVPTYSGSQPVRYRATLDPAGGLPRVTTNAVDSSAWGAPDFADEFSGTTLGAAWSTRGTDYNPAGLRGLLQGLAGRRPRLGRRRSDCPCWPTRPGATCARRTARTGA